MPYPSLKQALTNKETGIDDRQIDRATNGKARGRMFFTSQPKSFAVVHPGITTAEKDSVVAFRSANLSGSFDFTWANDSATYTCIFDKQPPEYTRLAGGRWDVTVYLTTA